MRQASGFPATSLRPAAEQATAARQLSPLHEQDGLEGSREVALEGRHAPLARDAGFAAQAPVARLLDEAQGDQLLKGLVGSIIGQTAFARGVANGECYSAVVEAVVSEADLDVDCAGWRGKRPPGV